MWFGIIVPGMLAAVWVWPRLRVARFWFGISLVSFLGATVWLGTDLSQFVQERGTSERAAVRLLHTLFIATDLPALPVVLGSFITGLISAYGGQAARSASGGTHVSGNLTPPNEKREIVDPDD